MKRVPCLFAIYFCINVSVYAQKSALDYLNNAPKPTVTPCACTMADYKKYEQIMDSYCSKIRADIDAREEKATKNDLSYNVEYKNLFEQILNQTQIPALKFYCLDIVGSDCPELLSEAERQILTNDLQICMSATQNAMNVILHRASGAQKPEGTKESVAAQEEYCSIMSPKYKKVLDEGYDMFFQLMPGLKRLGEIEYSGPQEAKDINVLSYVLAYLSDYPARYYCGNLKIK